MEDEDRLKVLRSNAIFEATLELIKTGKTKPLVEVMPHVGAEHQRDILNIFAELDAGNFHNWHVRQLPDKTRKRRATAGRPANSEMLEDKLLSFLQIADRKYRDIAEENGKAIPTDSAIIRNICSLEPLAGVMKFKKRSYSHQHSKLTEARSHTPKDEFFFDWLLLIMGDIT